MIAGKALAPALARRPLVAAFSRPLSLAMRTAELVGLTGVKPDPGLMERDYGGYEGMTAAQISGGEDGLAPVAGWQPVSLLMYQPRQAGLCRRGRATSLLIDRAWIVGARMGSSLGGSHGHH